MNQKSRVMTKSRSVDLLVSFSVLAAVYFVAGKLGLRLAFAHPSATAVWPPTGIALAAFLILGYRVWPAVFLGAFLVNVTTAGSLATSVGIGVGNTLEALLGTYLVNRFARGRDTLNHPESVFRFAMLAAVFSTTVSATCGVMSLSFGGFVRWMDFGSIWLTWWLGDMAGSLVIAPVLLAWSGRRTIMGRHGTAFEAALLLGGLFLVSQTIFGGFLPANSMGYPLEFLCMPFLLWAAFRFRQREATTAVLLLSGSAIFGTLRGFGPFVRDTPNESLLLLQAYMGVASVTTLMLAAVVSEREHAAEQLRHLSTVDPLTGIANYRQLIDRLQAEIERSQRTARPFALLFLDLDGFKNINDRYGHLVGNRALCRVVEVLRFSCRAIDTPARFGGDEFVVILPETDEAAAEQLSRRIADRLARDRETPLISVSLGVAVYPHSAETLQDLIGAADRSLYEMKSLRTHSLVTRGDFR
jgi:diguanylate cyclase (GGDEF)-like protein